MRIPCCLVPAHPRRVQRHAWDGESDYVATILEQLDNRFRRNMTFNDITVHQCGVARRCACWHTEIGFELGQLRIICEIDEGPSFL